MWIDGFQFLRFTFLFLFLFYLFILFYVIEGFFKKNQKIELVVKKNRASIFVFSFLFMVHWILCIL